MDNTGVAMPATKIFEAADEFPAGDRWEALAWDVPQSEEFPIGLKYSFQYILEEVESIHAQEFA